MADHEEDIVAMVPQYRIFGQSPLRVTLALILVALGLHFCLFTPSGEDLDIFPSRGYLYTCGVFVGAALGLSLLLLVVSHKRMAHQHRVQEDAEFTRRTGGSTTDVHKLVPYYRIFDMRFSVVWLSFTLVVIGLLLGVYLPNEQDLEYGSWTNYLERFPWVDFFFTSIFFELVAVGLCFGLLYISKTIARWRHKEPSDQPDQKLFREVPKKTILGIPASLVLLGILLGSFGVGGGIGYAMGGVGAAFMFAFVSCGGTTFISFLVLGVSDPPAAGRRLDRPR